MHSSMLKRAYIAAMLFLVILLVLGLVGTSQATGYKGGVPWQVGDVIICFGNGTCNVVRIVGGVPKLLDQFSDTQLGDTRGVAINNTLHAVVTDNGSGGDSNILVYSIASVDPTTSPGTPIAHTPVQTTDASPNNAQTIVVNSIGHIFVGNAGSGGISAAPSIVELNPDGTLASPSALSSNPLILPSNCTDTKGQLLSMDLSKDGLSLYLTSNSGVFSASTSNGGNIQKLTLSTGTCAPFASFGPGVALYGIQDVPPSALTAVKASCNGTTPCPPTNETVLVVAEGFFDSDGDPGVGEPNGIPDQTEDVNICNSLLNSPLVSCALLLDTGGPGLTAPAWIATHPYSNGDTVLDANLHVQKVTSANGTSGGGTPAWSTNGGTTTDGPLTWTDQGTSVVARYPVTGTSTLQALSLDPLVRDCNGGTCSAPSPTVSNFWLGDSGSSNFYEVNFGSGTVSPAFDANADCSSRSGCNSSFTSIHGLHIYGAEGANQADLTKLFSGPLTLSNGSNPQVYAQQVSFPPNVSPTSSDYNTMNAGVFGFNSPPNAAFYASLVSQAAPAGNNSGATDSNSSPASVPCEPTTLSDLTKCIVWKIDVPTGVATPFGNSQYVSTNFSANTGIDFGTHVFLDEHYDVTTFLGNFDPGGGKLGSSVWSLQEVAATFSTSGTPSGCAFSSPVANTCYKTNRTTLPFTVPFCSGLTQTQFQALALQKTLLLSLIDVGTVTSGPKPPPNIIQLTSTNTKAPFRYDSTKNQLQFNWTVNGTPPAPTGRYLGCALDSLGTKGFTIEGFCVNFTLSNTCK